MIAVAAEWSWIDWIKFLPGWLAFVATGGTWVWKWRVRKHSLAIGPDPNDLREVLVKAREQFHELGHDRRLKD